jgi:hypothetical protein
MELTFTQIEIPQNPQNCYEINFVYEHGDADSETTYTKKLKNITSDFLIKYLTQVKIVSDMIDDSRSYGGDLPKYFSESEFCTIDGLSIPIEYDQHNREADNYYAAFSIANIYFFNEIGIKHKVTYS